MATRAKDAIVKKDKKPIAASSQAQSRGNPKPVAPSQLGSNDKVKSAATAAATSPAKKPTQNYLRSTLGSKPESSSPARTATRKSTTTTASNEDKARLIRRRSFDRPSSLLRQDSNGANKEAAAAAAATEASRLRTSSSLKSTGNSYSRVASGVHKPGGSRLVNPAVKSQVPVRRSSLSSPYKNGISSAHVPSTTSPTNAKKSASGSDPDNKLVETIEEGLVCSDAEAELVHSDEHLESEVLDTEVGNAKPSESEDQSSPHEVVVKEVENVSANDNNQAEDSTPDEVRVPDQNKGEENVIDGQEFPGSEQPAAEEKHQEEKGARDEETGGDQVTNQVAKEAEAPLQHQEERSVQKRVVVQGKKESPSAYNDVIEETKNKLLEARKNKVKALVGAFETVIDYESGSK